MKKILWPNFSPIIECDKPQGTNYKGPQAILTITVEVIRAFLQNLRGCWEHKFLKKKAIYPVKKTLWPIFLVLSNVTDLRGQFLRVQKVF